MEQSLTIRFAQIISGRLKRDEHGGGYFLVGEESQGEGWLILTTRGLRWHYPEDGIPALDRGRPQAWGVEGYRFAPYSHLLGASSKPQEIEIKGQRVAADVHFITHEFEGKPVIHMIGFVGEGAAENAAWLELVRAAAEKANPDFQRELLPPFSE